MAKGPTVSPVVEQLIAAIVREMPPNSYAKEILARATKTLKPLGYAVPQIRKVQAIAARVRGEERSPLDERWHIGAEPEHFTSEQLDFLIALARETWYLGRHFTVREAIWACRLRHIAQRLWPGHMPLAALSEGAHYAIREASAEAIGKPSDTMDLDSELAFIPWESPKNKWLYEQAIAIGHLPTSQRVLFEGLANGDTPREAQHAVVVDNLPEGFTSEDEPDWRLFESLSREAKQIANMIIMARVTNPTWLDLTNAEQHQWLQELVALLKKKEAQIEAEGG